VSFEIIALENGDVLDRVADFDEAADALRLYVETHRASVPGIEQQVGLLELDEADEPQGRCILYEDLTGLAAGDVVH
jgi:hypothetical protein